MTEKTRRILLWVIWLAACTFVGWQLAVEVRIAEAPGGEGTAVINQR